MLDAFKGGSHPSTFIRSSGLCKMDWSGVEWQGIMKNTLDDFELNFNLKWYMTSITPRWCIWVRYSAAMIFVTRRKATLHFNIVFDFVGISFLDCFWFLIRLFISDGSIWCIVGFAIESSEIPAYMQSSGRIGIRNLNSLCPIKLMMRV